MAGLIRGLGDLLLGVRCLGCSSGGVIWCSECLARSWDPRHWHVEGLPVVASGSYAETLRQALVKHKEHGQLALARPLGALLAAAVRELQPSGPWLIVPCPSAVVATRQRGHQHMRRVASAAAGQLRPYGAVTVIPTLRVSGPVTDQVGLTAAGRRVNLAGAFVARGVRTHRCPVIIADDIATTGATLTEAQRALAAAGWQVGGGAVIARTPARSGVAANARLG